ncbi:MAG TPA: AraC family transcriptional regulator [Acidiphilium sp.]
MTDLRGLTVYDHLFRAGVPLRASASFGSGVAVALWDRNEVTTARYDTPTHHTLSLYVSGGEAFRRRKGDGLTPSFGSGSLCLMPRGASSDWEVNGSIRMFHLYVSRQAFDRLAVETLDADPAGITLPDIPYFRDPLIEGMIRSAILPLNWDEPAERIATSHAGQSLIAYLIARVAERNARALTARGGLSPATLRRIVDFIEARIADPLTIADLASCAGLSPYHFAHAFKRSTGESPHGFVLRRRIERAKAGLRTGLPLAEISAACGFSSQSHFTARFRAATGVTPAKFRHS